MADLGKGHPSPPPSLFWVNKLQKEEKLSGQATPSLPSSATGYVCIESTILYLYFVHEKAIKGDVFTFFFLDLFHSVLSYYCLFQNFNTQ